MEGKGRSAKTFTAVARCVHLQNLQAQLYPCGCGQARSPHLGFSHKHICSGFLIISIPWNPPPTAKRLPEKNKQVEEL